MRLVRVAALSAPLLLVACATTEHPAYVIAVEQQSDGDCRLALDGQVVRGKYPDLDEQLIRKAMPDKRGSVNVVGNGNTPYRCIGGVVFLLQRMGYRNIMFASEPPPKNGQEANP